MSKDNIEFTSLGEFVQEEKEEEEEEEEQEQEQEQKPVRRRPTKEKFSSNSLKTWTSDMLNGVKVNLVDAIIVMVLFVIVSHGISVGLLKKYLPGLFIVESETVSKISLSGLAVQGLIMSILSILVRYFIVKQ